MRGIREKLNIKPPAFKVQLASEPVFDPAAFEKYKIDVTADITENPVLIKINGKVIATLQNFSLWIGKAKSKKTFLMTALTSAAAVGRCSIDKLVGVFRPEANSILYFDTEQSPYHAQRTIRRIAKQVGVEQPNNLTAYGLRPISNKEKLLFIGHKINNTPGIALAVIDGIADLLSKGINDEPEAIDILSKLMKWSEEKNIHIMLVLHMNKGDFNARGVIGSYLMQKAESTISINKHPKDRDISIVHAEYCRDIDFEDFAFTINDEGIPVLADQMEATQTRKSTQIADNFNHILPGMRSMNYTELCNEYMEASGTAISTAKRHISQAVLSGILRKDNAGNYRLISVNNYKHEVPF